MEYDFETWLRQMAGWKDFPNDGHPSWYPLLLQRAIEGVNREEGSLNIRQDWDCIYTCRESLVNDIFNTIKYPFSGFESIDQAKEIALKYVFEKER